MFFHSCEANIRDTVDLLQSLGFIIHPEKSVLYPTKRVEHLGFIMNSTNMLVNVNTNKIDKLKEQAVLVLGTSEPTIRDVAVLLGLMVSCLPGMEYGDIYYRRLDIVKTEALKENRGNFDSVMSIPMDVCQDITWWVNNVGNSPRSLDRGKPLACLLTDASNLGWDAKLHNTRTGGRWTVEEQDYHINVLEPKAVLFGLNALCEHMSGAHILVRTDNSTTVSYLTLMGGSKSVSCNMVAREIWLWCIARKIWLTVSHIPGVENVDADEESRNFNDKTEWKLCSEVFKSISDILGKPHIDLFASRLNCQLNRYVSWRPDPGATFINAFTCDWALEYNYIFPPFSLIGRVLKKLKEDQGQAILVIPYWPTQHWLPMMLQMLAHSPILLPKKKTLLSLPFAPNKVHPLSKNLMLMACRLSGIPSEVKNFQQKLKILSSRHGDHQQGNNMVHILKDGKSLLLVEH